MFERNTIELVKAEASSAESRILAPTFEVVSSHLVRTVKDDCHFAQVTIEVFAGFSLASAGGALGCDGLALEESAAVLFVGCLGQWSDDESLDDTAVLVAVARLVSVDLDVHAVLPIKAEEFCPD